MAVVVILITTVTVILFVYLRIFSSSGSTFNTNRWESFFFVFTFRFPHYAWICCILNACNKRTQKMNYKEANMHTHI